MRARTKHRKSRAAQHGEQLMGTHLRPALLREIDFAWIPVRGGTRGVDCRTRRRSAILHQQKFKICQNNVQKPVPKIALLLRVLHQNLVAKLSGEEAQIIAELHRGARFSTSNKSKNMSKHRPKTSAQNRAPSSCFASKPRGKVERRRSTNYCRTA